MTTTYVGQSLLWVRTLLGYQAKYATVQDAYEDALKHSQVETTTMPPVGSLAWFDIGLYGDVGLVVADWTAVRLSRGTPEVMGLRTWTSAYLGWSPADVLGEDEGTTMTHTEYGVRVTSDEGHRYLDLTFTTREGAETCVRFRTHPRARQVHPGTHEVVQRLVTYTLGEWEPVDA